MFAFNIFSNVEAVKTKFEKEEPSISTVKKAVLFIRDSDSQNVPFKDEYICTNGLFNRICNKRYIHDPSNGVVKLDNGHLAFASLNESVLDTEKAVDYVLDFEKFTNENNIDFLYVSVPNKMYKNNKLAKDGVYPQYGDPAEFLAAIEDGGTDTIEMAEEFESDNIDQYDLYFKTDHHWSPQGAFYAFQKICNHLKTTYGYEIDDKITDIEEYNVEKYPKYFVGTEGKRTGVAYSGKDDFSLIYPKFSTDLKTETWHASYLPQEYFCAEGSFYDAIFNFNNFNKGGSYTYSTYLGDEAKCRFITNFNADNDKKIMIICDSFGAAFSPFMSLICKELYIFDIRHTDINIKEYVKELGIDTVVVLYSNNTIMDVDVVLNFDKKQKN